MDLPTYVPGLTFVETKVMEVLSSKPAGSLFTRQEMSEKIFGYSDAGKTIDTHVARIRKKLGQNMITTVRGFGYVLGEIEICKECNGTGFKAKG